MGWLDGVTVLATGAGSGIGRAAVEAFVEEGAKVGVLELVPEKAEQLRADLGDAVVVIEGDATRMEDNERAVEATMSAFGGIDVLATFVGVFDFFQPLRDMTVDMLSPAFDEIFTVNVKSYLFSAKAALAELEKSEGSIIFTVSNSGFYPGGGGVLYTATKFAVRGLVVELAHELAPKIRVNGVAPGGTTSDLRGLHALGLQDIALLSGPPEELRARIAEYSPLDYDPTPSVHAGAYVYLASKARTGAVTGTIIQSDGGLGVRGMMRVAGLK
ncbi:3-(cis-5,6-dihydroxycyclohexa-1,3-dien-1-yl)propanoate dehydrogenase [Mycobacterium sp.]|uniref:3-(cis-5,6-dihydroxycyclohexa-1, 3-dien-1-yl)propanoate dehydrogenase n=1 Tax=Mycobacterium sp. TaxID=1785 RepID=UPI003C7370F5